MAAARQRVLAGDAFDAFLAVEPSGPLSVPYLLACVALQSPAALWLIAAPRH